MQKKNLFLAGIFIVVPVLVLISIKLVQVLTTTHVKFYYPDQMFTGMKSEKRVLTYNDDQSYFEEKIVEEYFLGPLNYRLSFPIDHEDFIEDIIRVKGNKDMVLIINFKEGFKEYALENMDRVIWLINGLSHTLKDNTDIRSIYFLERNRKIRLQVGDWQLFFPVTVK